MSGILDEKNRYGNGVSMEKGNRKCDDNVTPEISSRVTENMALATAARDFSVELRSAGYALTFYATGAYSNAKMWGVYSLTKERPRFSKDCDWLSQSFSSVGITKRCRAYTSLLELRIRVLSIVKKKIGKVEGTQQTKQTLFSPPTSMWRAGVDAMIRARRHSMTWRGSFAVRLLNETKLAG